MSWSHVANSAAKSIGPNTSPFNLTAGAAAQIGDRVVVELTVGASGSDEAISSVSGTFCGTFSKDAECANVFTGINIKCSVWSAPVTSAGTPVITVSFTGTGPVLDCDAALQIFSGLDTSVGAGAVDTSGTATGNSTAPSATTGSTTAANELIVGGFGDGGAGFTWTAGSSPISYTLDANAWSDNGSSLGTVLEYGDSGSSGATKAANATISSSTVWGAVGVVYKLASVAAAEDTAYTPTSIATKCVGPMALRNSFRRSFQWSADQIAGAAAQVVRYFLSMGVGK